MIRPDGTGVRSVIEYCRLRGCRPAGHEEDCPRCGTLRRYDDMHAMLIVMKRAYTKDLLDRVFNFKSPWDALLEEKVP